MVGEISVQKVAESIHTKTAEMSIKFTLSTPPQYIPIETFKKISAHHTLIALDGSKQGPG